MNARTIQHPGIEINEIDMTEYRDTVTTNNAYVIGFADRGPIYDYSWITTRSEFINLYGEPQNEAEKYLYYAVQSILNNGGTPIVARMPYDNKQCKAYKGLKIKYASYKKDDNVEGGVIIYDWNNSSPFPVSAQPLINLDDVGHALHPDKYDAVLSTLVNQKVDLINYPSNSYAKDAEITYNELPSSYIRCLTYRDLLYNLAPSLAVKIAMDPSGASVYGSDEDKAYDNAHNAISDIEKINAFLAVDAHPDELKTVCGVQTLDSYNNPLTGLSGALEAIYTACSSDEMKQKYGESQYKINVDGNLSGLHEIFNFYKYVTSDISMNDPIRKTTYTVFDSTTSSEIEVNVPNYYRKNSPVQTMNKLAEKLYDLIQNIIDINTREGKDLSAYNTAKRQLNLLKIYINAKSTKHDKHVSGVYNLLSSATTSSMFNELINCKLLNDNGEPLTGESFNIKNIFNVYNNNYDGYLVSANCEVPSSISEGWATTTAVSDTYNDCFSSNSGVISSWIDVFDREIEDSKIVAKDYYRAIRVNDQYPSALNIPENVILNYVSGILSSDYLNEPISSYNSSTTGIQKLVDNALAVIYNDPCFKPFADTITGQAIVDAKLLTQDEIHYTYGVYLDSKECDISNEQYDDLVTTNNFTKADLSVSKYGEDIDTANFVIIDKQKTIVDGTGSNEGYFVTIIDPYDGLKNQRLLVNPCEDRQLDSTVSNIVKNTLPYYADKSAYNWKLMFKNEINTLNTLQKVKNADGIWVGEANQTPGKEQLLDSWSVPLTGNYYDESISKSLMNMFPQIPLTDVASNASSDNPLCMIDKQYSSHIVVAVCKTAVNPSDGKITVSIIEQLFGSLFDEKNIQNGRDLYIGNIINANSNYIEFYRNNYIKPKFGSGYDPEPYNKTAVPQFFIKDSAQLNNACKMVGIDQDTYDVDNVYFYEDEEGWHRKSDCPAIVIYNYEQYINELTKNNIFIFNKKNTILYNHHPEVEFTSFSKKEAQKIIANTTGLFGQEAGTTANIGDNFIIDMDRCISFIKNIDDIPIYFVADAGLSTIAQFCDNVVWDQQAMKWVTQNFDPDNDPDQEDRYITDYSDVATWRKVVDKLDQISREIRRDCMTIIDAPRQLTLDGSAPKIRRTRPQNTWDDLVGNKLRFISGINSSYCAGYYNWLRTTDDFSGRSFWLPPTCKIIGNYMYLNIVNLPWLAPAGLSYGVINGIHGISHNPDPNEEDQIYLKSWNYIKQYPFDGFIIEGQKTTLTKNSAFNRVNVRTLFLDLERFVYNVARNFKYQVNNSYTREQFVQTIKPKFEDYMIRGGLYDYLIKCDDTNNTPETIDANELRCAIYLKPARLIEFIMIDMIAAKTRCKL